MGSAANNIQEHQQVILNHAAVQWVRADLQVPSSLAILMFYYTNPKVLPEASWVWGSGVVWSWELPDGACTFCRDASCRFPRLSRSATWGKQEASQRIPWTTSQPTLLRKPSIWSHHLPESFLTSKRYQHGWISLRFPLFKENAL